MKGTSVVYLCRDKAGNFCGKGGWSMEYLRHKYDHKATPFGNRGAATGLANRLNKRNPNEEWKVVAFKLVEVTE